MVGFCCSLVCYAGYTCSRTGYIVALTEAYICNPFTGEKIQLHTHEWDSDFWAEPAIGFDYNHSSGGALHWIDRDTIKRTTVAFHLEHETFELLPSRPPDAVDYANVGLMVLGGKLCVLDVVPSKHVRIWELRSRKMWLPMFSIAWEDWSWFDTFALTKSDKFLLWQNVILSSYDSETKMLRKLDETLKKLMDDCTPSVYTTTRAIRFMNPHVSKAIMEERVGKKSSYRNNK
ncbi:uncharacterized protein LOC113347838 [Papaver somniferum]|uniref:uncharacterized protein LOC113347838 n=1 Tax=Papaver somniferum TaxID=3469 RepID=UPI000E6F78A2|nr:uncharacterized protein LOC113347838 [Papaver somniferum]XP_026447303.1 uncharacterized protein LOC113347838 [Papaver somniferum]